MLKVHLSGTVLDREKQNIVWYSKGFVLVKV